MNEGYQNGGLLPSQQTQQNFQNNWMYANPNPPPQYQQAPLPQTYQQPQAQPLRIEPQIIAVSVSSAEEAEKFPLAPGRTVFLIDYANRQFWLKRRDETGLMLTFLHHTFTSDEDVKQTQQASPVQQDVTNLVTREEFEQLKNAVEELLK